MNEIKLANELQNWFNLRLTDKNKWSRNLVGKVIKSNLKKIGNWKNAPRGNPSKGGKTAKENKLKKECNW